MSNQTALRMLLIQAYTLFDRARNVLSFLAGPLQWTSASTAHEAAFGGCFFTVLNPPSLLHSVHSPCLERKQHHVMR